MKNEYEKCIKGCGNVTPHKTDICMACRKQAKAAAKKVKKSKPAVYAGDM